MVGIGSGGNYSLAAGKVLMGTDLNAEQLAKKAIEVAAEIFVFTNYNKIRKNIMDNSNVTQLHIKKKTKNLNLL